MAAIKGITAFDVHGFTGSPLPQQILVWRIPARVVMEVKEEAEEILLLDPTFPMFFSLSIIGKDNILLLHT